MTPKERAAMQQALEALHYAVMASVAKPDAKAWYEDAAGEEE